MSTCGADDGLPVARPLPGLPALWMADACYIRAVDKVSAKGFKQKRVLLVRRQCIILVDAKPDATKAALRRHEKITRIVELVYDKDSVLFRIPDCDILLVFGNDARNEEPFSMQVFLNVMIKVAQRQGHQLPVRALRADETFKSLAGLQKSKSYLDPSAIYRRNKTADGTPASPVSTGRQASAEGDMSPVHFTLPSEAVRTLSNPSNPRSPRGRREGDDFGSDYDSQFSDGSAGRQRGEMALLFKAAGDALGIRFEADLTIGELVPGGAAEQSDLARFVGGRVTYAQHTAVATTEMLDLIVRNEEIVCLNILMGESVPTSPSRAWSVRNAKMRDDIEKLRAEKEELLQENSALTTENGELRATVAKHEDYIAHLEGLCEQLSRTSMLTQPAQHAPRVQGTAL